MYELTHFAINADDVQQARRFYRETFGWEFSAWGPPGFYRIEAGAPGGPGVTAALQQRRDLIPGRPVAGFESTVAVPDVAAVTAAALAAGGAGADGQDHDRGRRRARVAGRSVGQRRRRDAVPAVKFGGAGVVH